MNIDSDPLLMVGARKPEVSKSKYSREEVAARGEAIYEQQIRPKVESQSNGKYLVLDIETGEYEIDQDDLVATKRTLAKHPDAVLYGLRIGHPAAYRLGRFSKVQQNVVHQ